MANILDPSDLAEILRQPNINEASAVQSIRMAEGWLQAATRMTSWPPDPTPEDVRAWAMELAMMTYADPQAMTSLVGESGHSLVRLQRRQEILDAAHRVYAGEGRPQGSFPCPAWYPDPSLPRGPFLAGVQVVELVRTDRVWP